MHAEASEVLGDWAGRIAGVIVQGVKMSGTVKMLASDKSWTCEAMAD